MLFKYAAKEDFIFADPATSLDLPKEEKRLPRIILSEDEIDQLVNQSNQGYLGLRNRAILETFYATGMRVTELITLNIYSINQHDLTVRIKGKGRKDRIVPISGRALILVQKYINELRPTLAKRNKDADNTLFLGQLGKQMKRADLSNMLKMLAEKAALEKKVTPHVIRHSVATHLLRHGMDIRYIQELLGHEDLRTTQIYTKVENKDLRDMLDRYHPLN
jgi:integrase/recombinase XerD